MRNLVAEREEGELYGLTTLQIGDMQSYVSRLFLLVANESLKLVFIVDNGPWTTKENRSRPAELWQLMVSQSRVSPFANRRKRSSGEHSRDDASCESTDVGSRPETLAGWPLFKNILQRRCKALALVRKPSHGLHGCVAFEVEWANVRGINYCNELQTDTCVALEVKTMIKREFDSLEQAQACYALERCEPISQTSTLTARASGDDGATQRLLTCPGGCCCASDNFASSWSADGSRSTDDISNETQQTQVTSSADEASDYATVISFGGLSKDSEDELGRRALEFLTPPSSPQNTLSCPDFWTCCGWEEKSLDHIEQNLLNCVCTFHQQERSEGAEELLENLENKCESYGTSSSSYIAVASRGQAVDDWGLWPSASKGSFDMGRPPGTNSRGGVSELGGCYWRGMHEEAHLKHQCLLDSAHSLMESETYRDTLIVFRFIEPLLPFELQRLITSDPRLLKMLESGLPSWVIFLQSYPFFSQLYQPWMRPLCGTIYYVVSVVTVLIGFYDLYKNVPVLKATAARLCGPLFEWIEAWEMISRLKYLGTMLILQNFEKAFRWMLMTVRAIKQLSILLVQPIVEPLAILGDILLPAWSGLLEVVLTCWSLISTIMSSTFMTVGSLLNFILWPFIVLLSTVWNLGVYPVLVGVWALLWLPLQLVRVVLSIAESAFEGLTEILQLLLTSTSPALKTLKSAKAATPPPSLWRALWNDILSKIFRSVRSIVNGFVAFFTACNRHRLSIYNHVVACLFRLGYMVNSGQSVAVRTCQQMFLVPSTEALKSKEKVEVREDELGCRELMLRWPPGGQQRSVEIKEVSKCANMSGPVSHTGPSLPLLDVYNTSNTTCFQDCHDLVVKWENGGFAGMAA